MSSEARGRRIRGWEPRVGFRAEMAGGADGAVVASEGELPVEQPTVTFQGLQNHLLDDLFHVGNSHLQPPPAY